MSDPAPATVPIDSVYVPSTVTVDSGVVVAAAKTAVVDFANKSELLKFVIKKIAEVEILGDRSDEDKAKFVVEEVKKAIRESPLSDEQKSELAGWCDVSLPYVIEAVKLVKAEASKVVSVALAEVKKCCPSWFAAKKPVTTKA